jgi:hypothetical protein
MSLLRDYRPAYNPNLPLNGYFVVLAGRLPKTADILQKEIEHLGGTFLSTIDATVGVVISTQGYLSYCSLFCIILSTL